MQKNDIGPLLYPISLHMGQNSEPNIGAKTIQLWEEIIQENLHDVRLGNDFLATRPKNTEQKKDKLDYVKIKNFWISKDTTNQMPRQNTEWEKIFANHLSNKGLISRIYK